MQVKPNAKVKNYILIALLFFPLLFVQNGYAEGGVGAVSGKQAKSDPLLITLSTQKIQVDAEGKELFLKADKVKPGDIVQYKAIYRNRGNSSIAGLNASLPVPSGMEYVGKSARPKPVLASVDGISYQAEPLVRQDKVKGGVVVPYAEYQALRWEIGALDAGKSQEVTARMRVGLLPKSAAELVSSSAQAPVQIGKW